MSRWFCTDDYDHKRQAQRDFERRGPYGYDRDRYRDPFDDCNRVYTKEFDRLRHEEDRRQERLEEERLEQRRIEHRRLEREREECWQAQYEQEQQEDDREQEQEPEQKEMSIVGFEGP